MLSSLTLSFSRPSMGTRSRHNNASTGSTSTVTPETFSKTRIPQLSLSQRNRELPEPAQDDTQAPEHPQLGPDPRLIYRAHTSSYWTGRFTALHDRLRGELLKPDNLAMVINGFNEEATIMLAHASAANNPSISVYAPSTALRPRGIILSHSRPRIPLSSTSGAVLQTTRPAPILPPPRRRESNTAADVAMLADDDTRRRRALLKLESLCATAEARESFRVWQAAYARREGRAALLPRGCKMDGNDSGEICEAGSASGGNGGGGTSGLVSRLFGAGRNLVGDKARRRTPGGGS